MPKVSVLVPICNVEKFLDKCLYSIVNQTLKDIEIVCINDGSKDGSLEIIKRYASKDSRIVVIDKPNSGYGDSMNKGLDVATGEYIGIVESDDFIEKEMFEELYSLAVFHNADIVKSNFNLYWENPVKYEFCNNLHLESQVLFDCSCRKKVFESVPAIWSAVYKRRFLSENNIRFLDTPGASYQDTSFKFKTTFFANNIVLTPTAYLNYRQDNMNSSVKIASKEKVLMLHKEYEEIFRFLKENSHTDFEYGIYLSQKIEGLLWNYRRINKELKKWYFNIMYRELLSDSVKYDQYKPFLSSILNKGAYNAILDNDMTKYRFMMRIHKLSKRIF